MRSNSSELRMHEATKIEDDVSIRLQSPALMLEKLTSVVASGKDSYENHAELIEDCSYAICEEGSPEYAVIRLLKIASFFENLENKNEENSRDLADIYLLIGQLYQFTGDFEESVVWFKKATVVDDQYTVSYHNIALSYIKMGEIDGAIRSLVQEVLFSPGNYYSYLILADLYENSKRYSEVEQCLQQLLERDPDNIQGLHRLICYYTMLDVDIDVQLLIRRLLSVRKTYTSTEFLIRALYFCTINKFKDALSCTQAWCSSSPNEPLVRLARAFIFEKQHQINEMHNELRLFKQQYANRDVEVMRIKVNEFSAIFSESRTKSIRNFLLAG